MLHFSHVRRLRAQPNGQGTLKKTSRTTTSQRVESTRRKTSENIKTWLKMVPEAPRSPPRGALGVPKIRCWWLGGLLGRRVGRSQDSRGSLGGRRRVAGTAPEPLRQLFGNCSAIVRQLFGNCASPWVAFGRPFGSICAAGLCGTTKVIKFAS